MVCIEPGIVSKFHRYACWKRVYRGEPLGFWKSMSSCPKLLISARISIDLRILAVLGAALGEAIYRTVGSRLRKTCFGWVQEVADYPMRSDHHILEEGRYVPKTHSRDATGIGKSEPFKRVEKTWVGNALNHACVIRLFNTCLQQKYHTYTTVRPGNEGHPYPSLVCTLVCTF